MRKKSRVVFVGCLNPKVTEDILKEKFEEIGPIENINIARDKDGKTKYFAYVTYVSPDDAEKAINKYDDTIFYDRILHVETYQRKRRNHFDEEGKDENKEPPRASTQPRPKEPENDSKHESHHKHHKHDSQKHHHHHHHSHHHKSRK